jgi:multimeric flavodoxin WrbA
MSRILGVMGSPRANGNTHALVSRILDTAKAHGAETELVCLGDLRIRQCDGCHVCWKTGKCAKNDDMQLLYPKLIEADAIALGTPVYWYGPTAIMKAFIDRLVYFNCPDTRPGIRGHRAVLAIPFEDTTLETAELLVGMLEKSLAYLEMPLVGQVVVPGVGERGEVLEKAEALLDCERLGCILANEGPESQ